MSESNQNDELFAGLNLFEQLLRRGCIASSLGFMADCLRALVFAESPAEVEDSPGLRFEASLLGKILYSLPRRFSPEGAEDADWPSDQSGPIVNSEGLTVDEVDLLYVLFRDILRQAVVSRSRTFAVDSATAIRFWEEVFVIALGKSHPAVIRWLSPLLEDGERLDNGFFSQLFSSPPP